MRVWDLPTRLFHWSLAIIVAGSVLSAKIGGDAMAWHFRFGYAVLTLLCFRLVWGFIGGHWSRFATFVPTPARLSRYLRGAARADDHFDIGHSPLGALSVLGMLAILCIQVATGLVADDEIAYSGPLAALVSGATSLQATAWHKGWGQSLVIGLVLLHVAAIAFYRIKRGHDLVGSMLHGDKTIQGGAPATADRAATRWFAVVVVAACAAAVGWVLSLGG